MVLSVDTPARASPNAMSIDISDSVRWVATTTQRKEPIVFGLNLSSIDWTHLETIWKPLEPVSDAIKTARDVAIDVGMGVRDMTAGVVRDLAKGDIGEALASAKRGYDRALFSSVER